MTEDMSIFGEGRVPPPDPPFTNGTRRQLARISIGGERLRIKLSNLYGRSPLRFAKARIAIGAGGGAIVLSTDTAVTFGGGDGVTVEPGSEVWSDEVPLAVTAGTELAVSWYASGTVNLDTGHRIGPLCCLEPGDTTSAETMTPVPLPLATTDPDIPAFSTTYWMAQIDVVRTKPANVIVAFGDSLTDVGYPAELATRILGAQLDPEVSLVNMGLGGNRWLHDVQGPRGVERFKRDVLDVPGVTHALVMMGINDIGYQDSYTPDQCVTAPELVQAVAAAAIAGRSAGVKVYFGTLTPYGGSQYFTERGEAIRQELNQWIRSNTDAVGFVDFDLAVRDPADPSRLISEFGMDFLHHTVAGQQRMAEAIRLDIFS
jgi:lysophospholipase L1-like esterase